MLEELNSYTQTGHFLFSPKDSLKRVCNAPTNKSGVYLIYALKSGQSELVYIGCSGRKKSDGSIFVHKAGLGGLKDRLVNGKQFGKTRRISWQIRMSEESIDKLKIHWYVTHNADFTHCPKEVEKFLLLKHAQLPKWNQAI